MHEVERPSRIQLSPDEAVVFPRRFFTVSPSSCFFRYFAGLVFSKRVEDSGDIRILDIPGGRRASYWHVGPHSGISAAFQKLYGDWLPTSGYELDDRPELEIYRNDAPPDGLIADLFVPVK